MRNKLLNRAFSWYFTKRALPYWAILGIDCIILFISGFFGFIVGHSFSATVLTTGSLLASLAVYEFVAVVCFRLFRTYYGILRYSSFVDLQRIGCALVLASLIMMILCSGILPARHFERATAIGILITTLLSVLIMWTVRILVKRIFDFTISSVSSTSSSTKVFIYGVMTGGVALARSINSRDSKFSLAGFVSDDKQSGKHSLMGVPVYINSDGLAELMIKKGVKALMVSPLKSSAFRSNHDMVSTLLDAGIKIYMLPSAEECNELSSLSHNRLREVRIEDLLSRAEITIDLAAIGDMLRGKRVLITGAAGSIGSEIARQIATLKPETLLLVDQAETPLHDVRLQMNDNFKETEAPTIVADICDSDVMESLFIRYRPEYIFHAAAYKHVPMMEDNPTESVRNNVVGTKVVADLAVKYGATKFVMISTDKAVNPTNVMGCSKRICEIYVQSLDKAIAEGSLNGKTRFVTTRFGNVLGSNGSVIPIFKEQIKKGGPVTVTHPEIIRFFMLISEACNLVLEAGSMGNGGEIFVFDMGNPVKIADLAKRMILLSGAKDIEIKYTGLRDGEKLYEEVLDDKETTIPTFHPKIKIAKVREYDYNAVDKAVDCMVKDLALHDDMHTVAQMKQLVPEYVSKHSKYEILDK